MSSTICKSRYCYHSERNIQYSTIIDWSLETVELLECIREPLKLLIFFPCSSIFDIFQSFMEFDKALAYFFRHFIWYSLSIYILWQFTPNHYNQSTFAYCQVLKFRRNVWNTNKKIFFNILTNSKCKFYIDLSIHKDMIQLIVSNTISCSLYRLFSKKKFFLQNFDFHSKCLFFFEFLDFFLKFWPIFKLYGYAWGPFRINQNLFFFQKFWFWFEFWVFFFKFWVFFYIWRAL